jgi:hypothetical protein
MAKLYDEICRILATPMPRSRALKLIFGGLVGAVLAPFGFGQDPSCGQDPTRVCPGLPNGCCPENTQCCLAGDGRTGQNHCCPRPQTCCGDTCCTPSQHCDNNVCVANPTPRNP